MNFNRIQLVGRLVADPTYVIGDPSKNLDNRCSARLAVNRSSAKDSPYDVFNIVAWAGLADILHRFAKKGKELLVEGSVRINNKKKVGPDGTVTWENYFEVKCDSIQLGQDAQPREEKEPEAKTPEQLLAEITQGTGINQEQLHALIAGAILSARGRAAQEQQAPGEPPDGSYSPDFPM